MRERRMVTSEGKEGREENGEWKYMKGDRREQEEEKEKKK
jgi:hypothetical protein